MVSDKADFISHTFDYTLNKEWILEDPFTVWLVLLTIKVALEEYDFKQIEQVDLHSIVLVVNHLSESFQNGVNYDMSDLI